MISGIPSPVRSVSAWTVAPSLTAPQLRNVASRIVGGPPSERYNPIFSGYWLNDPGLTGGGGPPTCGQSPGWYSGPVNVAPAVAVAACSVAKAAVALAAGATIWPNPVGVGPSGPADWPVGVISHTELRPPGVAVAKSGAVGVGPPRCWPTTSSMLLNAIAASQSAMRASAHRQLIGCVGIRIADSIHGLYIYEAEILGLTSSIIFNVGIELVSL